MSKQVYIVKNSKGEVIGARQSARPYTHALIINDSRVESYSASEAGANRAISKFFQYKDEAFKAATQTAVAPVECIGAAEPVKLTVEGYAYKIKTFHAYKYAVINTATGRPAYFAQPQEALCYTFEQAQAHAAWLTRREGWSLEIAPVIDPRAS